jgi:hypothetical protein
MASGGGDVEERQHVDGAERGLAGLGGGGRGWGEGVDEGLDGVADGDVGGGHGGGKLRGLDLGGVGGGGGAMGERDEDRDDDDVGHHVLPDLVDAHEVPQHPAHRAREVYPATGGVVVRAGGEQRRDATIQGLVQRGRGCVSRQPPREVPRSTRSRPRPRRWRGGGRGGGARRTARPGRCAGGASHHRSSGPGCSGPSPAPA